MRYYPDILKLIHQGVIMGSNPNPGRAVQSLSRSTCWEIPQSVSEVVFWHGIQCFFLRPPASTTCFCDIFFKHICFIAAPNTNPRFD